MKPLAIIPTYVRTIQDLQVFGKALSTLRETAGEACDVLVVDDGSPAHDLVQGINRMCQSFDAELVAKETNDGFSQTVNIGLQRCLDEGRDAVLINADIEFGLTRDWLRLMQEQRTSDGQKLASIVGALLLYPNGTIQHGGILFSFLTRDFHHSFHFGPGDLPEAQVARVSPVTGALQFIRHECLGAVGIYDPTFRLGWEDVDICIRTMLSGRECVYQPSIRAVHHESMFRGRATPKIQQWTQESWLRFCAKYAEQNFAALVPTAMT